MKKKMIRLLPVLLTIFAAGIIFCCSKNRSSEVQMLRPDGTEAIKADGDLPTDTIRERVLLTEPPTETDLYWVYVCGSVNAPGVYALEAGARVFEAIERAGGIREDAAAESLNLAGRIEDGQQIYVPGRQEADAGELYPTAVSDGKININTASSEELMTLPGIGQARAAAIIAYREQKSFGTIEEIMNVSGIKESSFQKLKDLIKV